MMKQTILCMTLTCVTAYSTPVVALEKGVPPATLGEMYEACQAAASGDTIQISNALFHTGFCFASIEAVRWYTSLNCIGSGVDQWDIKSSAHKHSVKAAVQALVNYAQAHPEKWKDRAIPSIEKAMVEYFPCSE